MRCVTFYRNFISTCFLPSLFTKEIKEKYRSISMQKNSFQVNVVGNIGNSSFFLCHCHCSEILNSNCENMNKKHFLFYSHTTRDKLRQDEMIPCRPRNESKHEFCRECCLYKIVFCCCVCGVLIIRRICKFFEALASILQQL
jgi:hypothetical protein